MTGAPVRAGPLFRDWLLLPIIAIEAPRASDTRVFDTVMASDPAFRVWPAMTIFDDESRE